MRPTTKNVAAVLLGQALAAEATPLELVKRQCPPIHVFGARETTVSQGYGSAATVVNLVLNSHAGATAEAIVYPACGGQSSCGGISYANSVVQGINAVVSAVEKFHSQCPDTQLVLVGYSQGGHIMDDALCGGGDPNEGYPSTAVPLSAGAVGAIKAAIFMGNPRWIAGLSFEVGTCKAGGFDARPAGFVCPSGSKIQSYCDAPDPYCCNGNDAATHQGYGGVYGQAALNFINSKLGSSSGGGTATTSSAIPTGTGSGSCSALYGQCGGTGWTGATCCSSGTCKYSNAYYSQCL